MKIGDSQMTKLSLERQTKTGHAGLGIFSIKYKFDSKFLLYVCYFGARID